MSKVFVDQIPPETGRKYSIVANPDGTSSIVDVTQYVQEGTVWGAADANEVMGKQDKITASGILKGAGAGSVSAAVAGTDYAMPAVDYTVSLSTTWTGSSAPYTQDVTVTGLSASAKIFVGLADNATDAEYAAAAAAQLMCTAKAANQITVTARGVKPTIAIPIIVRVVG